MYKSRSTMGTVHFGTVMRGFTKYFQIKALARHSILPRRMISSPSHILNRALHTSPNLKSGTVSVHFIFADGKRRTVEAKQGTSLLDVVIDHDVDIDGFGACEATLACSTCHVVLPQDVYDKLPPPIDEEMDMLDLAYQLTDTSRLGCQIILTKELDGLEVKIPEGVADARG